MHEDEVRKISEKNDNIIKEDEISEIVDVKMHEVVIEKTPASEKEAAPHAKEEILKAKPEKTEPEPTLEPEKAKGERPEEAKPEESKPEKTESEPALEPEKTKAEKTEEAKSESTQPDPALKSEKPKEAKPKETEPEPEAKPKETEPESEAKPKETKPEPEANPGESKSGDPKTKSEGKPQDEKLVKEEKPEEIKPEKAPSAAKTLAKAVVWNKKTLYLILVIVAGAFIALYFCMALIFKNHFFPHTQINGVSCDYKTSEETEDLIRGKVSGYTLILQERNNKQETISGADIQIAVSFDGQIRKLLEQQNEWKWPAYMRGEKILLTPQTISYDEAALNRVIDQLECTDESQMVDSKDAHLTEYTEEGYQIVDEVYGTRLNRDIFNTQVKNAVSSLKSRVNLAQSGCYIEPVYKADSEPVQAMLEKARAYTDTTVTYEFGNAAEVIDGAVISQWIRVDDELNVSLDEEAVGDYLITLEEQYNTTNKAKTLRNSYGKTVTVRAGNYGWRINHAETKAALLGYLENHENFTGEVIYKQTANSHGENDYGNTYVEVNIGAQHLWFYKNGALILESDFVSGNVNKGTITHPGAYYVAYKKKNAVLKGEDYETPVNYWMPFNNGEGFHDALWRKSFGGNIYKTSGSHGCVNLPLTSAKTIFNNIDAGTPVLVY